LLDLPDPRDPGPDEVVIEVAAAGVGLDHSWGL
jgi:NADPH:quinone reductase-like Zn-dependent oxidoreductase